jgi:hypothetical protein
MLVDDGTELGEAINARLRPQQDVATSEKGRERVSDQSMPEMHWERNKRPRQIGLPNVRDIAGQSCLKRAIAQRNSLRCTGTSGSEEE